MMDTSLRQAFFEAGKLHGEAIQAGDHRLANRSHTAIIKTIKKMRKNEDQGVADLLMLLGCGNSSVVCWAATYLLPLMETVAKKELKKLAVLEASLIGLNAKMALQEWEAGRLKLE